VRQSSASILFVLLFLSLTFWIVWVAFQEKEIEPVEVTEKPKAEFFREIIGNVIRYKSFNDRGEWTLEVHAEKIEQLDEGGTLVRGAKASYRKPDGRTMHIQSEYLQDSGVNKVFSSSPGQPIVLEEEGGLRFETVGPLTVTPTTEFKAVNLTTFQLGDWKGTCQDLYFLPDKTVRLAHDVEFTMDRGPRASSLEAERVEVLLNQGKGTVHRGQFVMISDVDQPQPRTALFVSETIQLEFSGGTGKDSMRISEMTIVGPESRFTWDEGELRAPLFSVCMDRLGRYPQLIHTYDQTDIQVRSGESQKIEVQTGDVFMDFFETRPLELSGQSPISFLANTATGVALELKGGKGFRTEFNSGILENTRIFGTPTFRFEQLHGKAGFFRILHGQNKLMMSQTAEISQDEPNLMLSAEEILVSNWDQKDREIFGRAFIQIQTRLKGGRNVSGTGDAIFFNDYEGLLTLTGQPATFEDPNGVFAAQRFELLRETLEPVANEVGDQAETVTTQIETDGELVRGKASGEVRGRLKMGDSEYLLECDQLDYQESQSRCTILQVEKLVLAGLGELSAAEVELYFNTKDRALEELEAKGNIHFSGEIQQKGPAQKFFGTADRLRFSQASQVLELEGDNRDVSLRNNEGTEHKGRRLIYSLLDATMRVEAGAHSSTQTIVNIKKEKSN